jgi:hypothetical protein
MNEYRPEGWVNPYRESVSANTAPTTRVNYNVWDEMKKPNAIFEAGASAMLKMMRESEHSYGATILVPDKVTPIHGTYAFIPDNKKET